MSLIDCFVDDIITTKVRSIGKDQYGWDKWGYYPQLNPEFKMDPNDTYMVVFGPEQTNEGYLAMFEKEYGKHIIYKSKRALNNNHDGEYARNTLIIFEMKDE